MVVDENNAHRCHVERSLAQPGRITIPILRLPSPALGIPATNAERASKKANTWRAARRRRRIAQSGADGAAPSKLARSNPFSTLSDRIAISPPTRPRAEAGAPDRDASANPQNSYRCRRNQRRSKAPERPRQRLAERWSQKNAQFPAIGNFSASIFLPGNIVAAINDPDRK